MYLLCFVLINSVPSNFLCVWILLWVILPLAVLNYTGYSASVVCICVLPIPLATKHSLLVRWTRELNVHNHLSDSRAHKGKKNALMGLHFSIEKHWTSLPSRIHWNYNCVTGCQAKDANSSATMPALQITAMYSKQHCPMHKNGWRVVNCFTRCRSWLSYEPDATYFSG